MMSKSTKVTLKVDDATHRKLLEVVSKMQIRKGRRVTIDEAIKELIDHARY
jgi:predicted transcriptional regulator